MELLAKSNQLNLQKFVTTWVQKTNTWLAVLGLGYLAIYSIQVINSQNQDLVKKLELAGNVIWAIFVFDLALRLIESKSLKIFFIKNYIEILAVTLPFLRVLRMLRVLLAMRGLKIFVVDRAKATGLYVALLAPLSWFTGAIVVLDVESQDQSSSINSVGEALWWSLTTITTVGYGDLYPVTLSGKIVAAVLMITGISLFSAGAAMFSSWILGDKKHQ